MVYIGIFSDTPSPLLDESPIKMLQKRKNLFGDGTSPSAIQIAIDWDPTALHLRYQSTRERVCRPNSQTIRNDDRSFYAII